MDAESSVVGYGDVLLPAALGGSGISFVGCFNQCRNVCKTELLDRLPRATVELQERWHQCLEVFCDSFGKQLSNSVKVLLVLERCNPATADASCSVTRVYGLLLRACFMPKFSVRCDVSYDGCQPGAQDPSAHGLH